MNEGKDLPKKKLDIPQGVSAQGVVKDISEAYIKAVLAIPDALEAIANCMDAQTTCLYVIADYIKKKGIAEKMFEPDAHKELDTLGEVDDEETGLPESAN